MKRTYHQFPWKPELERKYNFKAGLPYIVRTIAGMNGQFGTFITDSPDLKGRPIQAKRSINIEITDRSVDFYPLNNDTVESVLLDVKNEGTVDFKVILNYSFLDNNFDRVPFKGDSFLVRTHLDSGILTMNVHHIDGMGRTECGRIADTIIDEIIKNAPK
jgi:hypothetical protein